MCRLICVATGHILIIRAFRKLQLFLNVVGGEELLGESLGSSKWSDHILLCSFVIVEICSASCIVLGISSGYNCYCKFIQAARETGALKEAKDKLEKRVEELTWRLQFEKRLRVILISFYFSLQI